MEDTDVVPDAIENFKERIRKAQIIIISTPEYNWSTSAALKNAIDWASRPPKDSAWKGKLVIIIECPLTGMLGGARAQYHLRQIFDIGRCYIGFKAGDFYQFRTGEVSR